MTIQLGTAPVTNIALGTTPVNKVYLGSTQVWSRAPVHYWFDVCGFLPGMWIQETIVDAINFISDGLTGIVDTAYELVADLVAFVPAKQLLPGIGNVGQLLGLNAPDTSEGICGVLTSVGGFVTGGLVDGILGFLNGIPIIGGLLDMFTGGLPTSVDGINSLIGTIPLVGDLARLLGIIPQADGTLNNPINFIVDAVGGVLGFITCGVINVDTVESALGFVIGGFCDVARMLIPDGLLSLDPVVGRMRHDTLVPADDSYMDVTVGDIGDSGMATKAFSRYSNTGGAAGVGIELIDSSLNMIRRTSGVDTVVAEAGAFTAGDMLRLDHTGDVHTLLRNGTVVGSWNDAGHTAAKGAAYRSTAVEMEGGKENMGPRRFSPGLLSIEAGVNG